MSNIEKLAVTSAVQISGEDNPTSLSFNDKVLSYLQQQQPDEKLNDLLNQLRALSPDKPVTQHQLYTALLSADGQMRKDEQYQQYAHSTLDELTFRMIGINMFYNNMLYKSFSQSDDAETF